MCCHPLADDISADISRVSLCCFVLRRFFLQKDKTPEDVRKERIEAGLASVGAEEVVVEEEEVMAETEKPPSDDDEPPKQAMV